MRAGLAILAAAAGAFLGGASPAAAACSFPFVNMGSFISGDRTSDKFAHIDGGSVQTQGANRYHATISGCAADARYRLMTGASAPIHVVNGGKAVDLVPFVVSVNGVPLATPIDLTHENSLVLSGNPDLEIVLAVNTTPLALVAGNYSGGYVMQFLDP